MGNRDTFEQRSIIYYLDKPYKLRFSMRAVYVLEEIYGTFKNAINALRNEETDKAVLAVTDFLHALLAVEKSFINEHIDIEKILSALDKITEAMILHFPDPDGVEPDARNEPQDWDALHYLARDRLHMSKDEFMDCTPRCFWKLMSLWNKFHGLEDDKPKEFYVDELPL